jgi:hypothetical protein
MEAFAMRYLMSIAVGVAVSAMIFRTEAREYNIWNEADDSFSVKIVVNDPRVVITPLTPPVCRGIPIDPDKISGCTEWPWGKGSVPREKRYNVVFEAGYVPTPGNEPFISFKNEKSEFRVVFLDENYAELWSDMASERHDDPERRKYDHLFTQSGIMSEVYDGYVRHWIVFDPYVAVYGYEEAAFALRAVYICDALNDTSWIETLKEIHCSAIGLFLPPRPPRRVHKHHWWSRLCCWID